MPATLPTIATIDACQAIVDASCLSGYSTTGLGECNGLTRTFNLKVEDRRPGGPLIAQLAGGTISLIPGS
jgi:hypothetical protein